MINQPWICPRCATVNAPWVNQCPCLPGATQPALPVPPPPESSGSVVWPWTPSPPATITIKSYGTYTVPWPLT